MKFTRQPLRLADEIAMFICVLMFLVGLSLLLPSSANGQSPTPIAVGIILTANTECEVGELVRFDATSSDVDDMTWTIVPKTPDFAVVDRRAFFSSRAPGKFLIFIAGAKEGQAFSTLHTLTVKDRPRDREPATLPETEADIPPVDREWRELTDSLERLDA